MGHGGTLDSAASGVLGKLNIFFFIDATAQSETLSDDDLYMSLFMCSTNRWLQRQIGIIIYVFTNKLFY